MHEIITLQFGQQSNYLGSHFWNTQESYFTYPPEAESPVNHDILFRPGLAPDGSDTFTPRALIYDLKGAFGSMRKVNALYEPEDDSTPNASSVWPSKPIIQRSAPISQSPYQAHLDSGIDPPALSPSTVRYWSDYSHLYYHPKSLVQLSEFDVNDKLMPFENWDVGMELFEKLEREAELVDRDLRPFVEECDGLQGIQIITGVDDAWGGWACGWMDALRDEFGKKSIWCWGLGDQGGNLDVPREKRLHQATNSARSLNVFAEQASVYIPVSNTPDKTPSYLTINQASQWHTSALQAVAMESVTIPSRLRASNGSSGSLQDLEETLNSTGKRRIAKLEMSIADPDVLSSRAVDQHPVSVEKSGSKTSPSTSDSDDDKLTNFDIDAFTRDFRTGSSREGKAEHIFGRVETLRGEWEVPEHGFRISRDRFGDGPDLQRYAAPLLFPVLSSFPSIFDVGNGRGKKLAVHTGLTTSTAVARQTRAMGQIMQRMMAVEERELLCDGLHTIAEEYDEGWSSGSDSDGDD